MLQILISFDILDNLLYFKCSAFHVLGLYIILFLLFVGLMAGASIFGPALGYILGGSLLNIYVDFPNPPPK